MYYTDLGAARQADLAVEKPYPASLTAHSELKMRGLRISDIKNQPYGRECVFFDPGGNGWVLQQPK